MATRILVVEDNPDNLYVMDRILRHAGYTVTQAVSGETALRLIADSTFDLILMDMQMPGLDGYTTVRAIRNIPTTVNIPIIAVTASSMPGDRERTLAAGCNDYVAKPIDTRMLLEVVAQYLGGASSG
jgi:CheY-like chemotaxis protein